MGKEQLQPQKTPEQSPQLSPEEFSKACDNLVDYQTSPKLLTDINCAVQNNRLVVFLLTHQSYFDIEVCRHLCEQVNQEQQTPVESYLIYSSPAVGLNIGDLLKSRDRVYQKCHLNMIGIVRDSDYLDPRYQKNITPEMEKESSSNKDLYNQKTNQGGCVSFIPFEATLKSGRINPETNTIYGMQEITNNLLLISAIRQKALIIPCGIDGSYKIVDPVEHKLSGAFKESIFTRNPQKIVTLKTGEPIDLCLLEYKGIRTRDLYHQATLEVAKLVPPEAQGDYSQYLAPKPNV